MNDFEIHSARRNVFPLWLWIALTLLPALAIFAFSSQDAAASGALSMRVLRWLLSRFPRLAALGSAARLHLLIRKLAHFTLYFFLGCGLRGWYACQRRVPALAAAIVTGAAYAASDEFHQRFSSGRYPSLKDILIDAGGVIAGCAFISLLFFLSRKRPRRF